MHTKLTHTNYFNFYFFLFFFFNTNIERVRVCELEKGKLLVTLIILKMAWI